MGCPGLKSSYQEKGLFQSNFVKGAMLITINRVIIIEIVGTYWR